ncbi:aldo/keto reductase family protein [Sulfurospirillum sp.]|uniref:aldo/keto reductase family protein n=1 Tax=Sulfurospirillum sp. TaxID=2053622 RepID=UPI002FDC9045
MDYVISNQNVHIPCMLYGTAWKKERTADLVALALEKGFKGIDTACQPKHYEEALVGEGLERFYNKGGKREALFIQTKFTPLSGQDPQRLPYKAQASLEEQIMTSCNVSKQNLRTEYLDSLLLHSPLFPYTHLLRAWRTLETLCENGDTHQIGISNCYDLSLVEQLYKDARIKPSVVQNRFYADSHYDASLRIWCKEQGIIYQSFWTLSANPHIVHSPTLQTIAHQYTKSVEQIFYRYVTQRDIIPLNGTTSLKHMEEDLSIFEFTLDDVSLEKIDLLFN